MYNSTATTGVDIQQHSHSIDTVGVQQHSHNRGRYTTAESQQGLFVYAEMSF
jgi:hypothetical protein